MPEETLSHISTSLSGPARADMNGTPVPKPKALVIDDEKQMRRLLRVSLEANGYQVTEATSGREGLTEAAQRPPDVVLLDLGLPDMDGVEVLKRLREWSHAPVVVISVRERQGDKIAALDNGADDYITKPFKVGELLARLRVAQRHAQPTTDSAVFKSGDLEMDLSAHVVKVKGQEVKLTATEYSLLRLFVQHAGRVLTHQQILREVWGPNSIEQTNYLRVYMAHLREKLEPESAKPTLLVTEPGVGYRLIEKD
jgi:two-component system KDP operon response regulator KdpE